MKLLVVLLVVLFGVWLWRRGRSAHGLGPSRADPPRVQSMLACARCGLHVPQASAVLGRSGAYCCEAHRQEAEGD